MGCSMDMDLPIQRPLFIVGTGRCGSTLLSEMIRLHPRLLSVSEWFTVLGERRALEEERVDARTFWDTLTVPTQDSAELLARFPGLAELRVPPRLLAQSEGRGIAPILAGPDSASGQPAGGGASRARRAHSDVAATDVVRVARDRVFLPCPSLFENCLGGTVGGVVGLRGCLVPAVEQRSIHSYLS